MKLRTLSGAFIVVAIVGFSSLLVESKAAEPKGAKEHEDAVRSMVQDSDRKAAYGPLRKVTGKFEHSGQWWGGNGEAPVEVTGNSDTGTPMGNFLVVEELSIKWGGVAFKAQAMLGYDSGSKEYKAVWIDDMSGRMILLRGPYEEKSKEIILTGDFVDAGTREPTEMRAVVVLPTRQEAGSVTLFRKDSGGTEYKFLEMETKARIFRAG